MPLSSMPSVGVTIPAGAKKVSVKGIDSANSTPKEEVTDLSSAAREYADPPLKDGGQGSVTQSCTASGNIRGSFALSPTPITVKQGWICTQVEEVYEAGKFATWSASWEYVEPPEET